MKEPGRMIRTVYVNGDAKTVHQTLADAYAAIYSQGVNIAIVVRVAEGADAAETRSNVVGSPGTGTGLWALTHARNLLGQTPRMFKSGRHDKAFYDAMWARMRSHGHWQGEISNRRFGVLAHPVRMPSGKPHHTPRIDPHVRLRAGIA